MLLLASRAVTTSKFSSSPADAHLVMLLLASRATTTSRLSNSPRRRPRCLVSDCSSV
ncbi:hypothetical protein PF008_g8736 [Phytophthora fragariae]|uniref:Uncharacterized protein n=1 Tax=Phytophthora fragariae TaxID=53985 RepID=A0A6G0S0A1_9STRA|nr:hypothetical protein PF008_g8736 [Phytophthora fragariae]